MIVTPGSTTGSCRTCVCLMAALCAPVVIEHFHILLTLIKKCCFCEWLKYRSFVYVLELYFASLLNNTFPGFCKDIVLTVSTKRPNSRKIESSKLNRL